MTKDPSAPKMKSVCTPQLCRRLARQLTNPLRSVNTTRSGRRSHSGPAKFGAIVSVFASLIYTFGCNQNNPITTTGGNTGQSTYSVAVTVSGLTSGTTVKVTDSDSGASVSTGNTSSITLESGLDSGVAYKVTLTPPTGQNCAFSSGAASGSISASNVVLAVTCTSLGAAISLDGPAGLIFDSTSTYLYVANETGNQVLIYEDVNTSGSSGSVSLTLTQTGSITNGINQPSRLAFDSAGYLYVTNTGNNTVTVYHPSQSLSQIVTTIATGISGPQGIAVDQVGNVYVANSGANTISEFSGNPTASFTLSATISQDGAGNEFQAPTSLMFSSFQGTYSALFVATSPTSGANEVLMYSTPFSSSSKPAGYLSNSSCPSGPDGAAAIAAYGATGSSSSGAVGSSGSAVVYVASNKNNTLTEYTLSAVMSGGCPTATATSGGQSEIAQPEGLAVDAFGIVFVANSTANTITAYDPITGAPLYTQH